MDVNNHSMLENKFGRFLAAKPVSAEVLKAKYLGRPRSSARGSYLGKSFAISTTWLWSFH